MNAEVQNKRRRVIEQKIVRQWPIDPFLCINVNQLGEKVRVRIVDTSENTAVEMTSPTFYEFCMKMPDFNVVYPSFSILCNNQLAIFSVDGECILQQIYEKNGGGFTMKPHFVKMNRQQIMALIEKCHEVKECVTGTLLCDVLPQSVRRNCHSVSSDFPTETFFKAVFDELMLQVNKLYYCKGCVWDHPSQRRHECLMDSSLDKYRSEGEKAIFHLNFANICANLINYDEAMFASLNVKKYTDYFEKCVALI